MSAENHLNFDTRFLRELSWVHALGIFVLGFVTGFIPCLWRFIE